MRIYVNRLTVMVNDDLIRVMESRGRIMQSRGKDIEVMLPNLEFSERKLESINLYRDNTLVLVTFLVDDHFERFSIDLDGNSDELCTIGIMGVGEDMYQTEAYKGMVFIR